MRRLESSEERMNEVLEIAVEGVVVAFKENAISPRFWDSPGAVAFIRLVVSAAAPIIEAALLDDLLADMATIDRQDKN